MRKSEEKCINPLSPRGEDDAGGQEPGGLGGTAVTLQVTLNSHGRVLVLQYGLMLHESRSRQCLKKSKEILLDISL